MMHWAKKTRIKSKWRHDNGGQLGSLIVGDDLGDLLGALDSHNGGGSICQYHHRVTLKNKMIIQCLQIIVNHVLAQKSVEWN
jgi:hypothetical protein